MPRFKTTNGHDAAEKICNALGISFDNIREMTVNFIPKMTVTVLIVRRTGVNRETQQFTHSIEHHTFKVDYDRDNSLLVDFLGFHPEERASVVTLNIISNGFPKITIEKIADIRLDNEDWAARLEGAERVET